MTGATASAFFQALGDPTRLSLVLELLDGERGVGELVRALGCPQPKVSRHLKVLKDTGLVRDRKDGRRVLYALATRASWPTDAREWVDRLSAGLPGGDRRLANPTADPDTPEVGTPKTDSPKIGPNRVRRGGDLETHLL